MANDDIRHKAFISYHHADQDEVDDFIRTFDHERKVFIGRLVGGPMATDVEIHSTDTEYVMRRIRDLYLSDSTVTIVMLGQCTWARKYVDWEIASSLRQGPVAGPPNGLIGILVPGRDRCQLPARFADNYKQEGSGYARYHTYPSSKTQLRAWIEDAFAARSSRASLITNGGRLRERNSDC